MLNTIESTIAGVTHSPAEMLTLILDAMHGYRQHHDGQAPELVYASPELFEALVLDLPPTINGTTVCLSPRLTGLSAAAQDGPFGLADLETIWTMRN